MKRSWNLSLLAGLLLVGCAPQAKTPAPVANETVETQKFAKFDGHVGLQLYSLRDQLNKDVPGTLNEVKGFGLKYVELAGTYKETPAQFKENLEKHGLKAISGHFPFERYRDDLDAVVREAKELGLQYAGCAWISHEGDFDQKTCEKAAEVFNRAGEALNKQGIKFFYHTHGYEFQPHGSGTLFDYLMEKTDAKYVSFEMDIFWIVHPGQDPVKILNRYGKRFELMHLKDMRKGTPTGLLTGHSDVKNDVALGQGQIDLPPLLRAARKAGVKWYFLEDESPTSEQQIPESLRYLDQVKL